MPEVPVKFNRHRSRSIASREGDTISVGGVKWTQRKWRTKTSLRVSDEYVSERTGYLERLETGDIVQVEIRGDKKSYAYRVKKINRSDHTEYCFRSCYGSSHDSTREVCAYVPDKGGSTDVYYGHQDKLPESSKFKFYWVSDIYILTQVGKNDLALSATI